MQNTKEQDKFLVFINDYIVFLEEMIDIQKRQLKAIIESHNFDGEKIKDADKTVVELQGYIKRLDVMEQRRLELQQEVGYGEMKFAEIIESVDASKKQDYLLVLEKFNKSISDMFFYRDKIKEKIESDLKFMNGAITQPSSYDSNMKQSNVNRYSGALEVKT